MTQQEIQERNKEIALMIGKKLISEDEFNMLGEHSYTGENSKTDWGIIEYLSYHRDWNWLMEAVEFIENKLKLETVISNMGFGSNNQYININRGVSIVDETIDNPSKIMAKSSTKKEAVFIAVSDFAKLYNNKEL
jgi:hypothetical protein